MLIQANRDEYSLQLPEMPFQEWISLIREAKEVSDKMGYVWDWQCFINYVIAHYQGDMLSSTFIPYYPLEKYDENI